MAVTEKHNMAKWRDLGEGLVTQLDHGLGLSRLWFLCTIFEKNYGTIVKDIHEERYMV